MGEYPNFGMAMIDEIKAPYQSRLPDIYLMKDSDAHNLVHIKVVYGIHYFNEFLLPYGLEPSRTNKPLWNLDLA